MCKYCDCNKDMDGKKIYRDESNSIGIVRRTFFDFEVYALYVRLLKNDISIVISINYCPMCGRKLGE